MKKFGLALLYSVFYILYSVHPVFAASEFTTTFLSEYTVEKSGETAVTHTITLKNNLAHIYATSYTLATSGDQLKNLVARDEKGLIESTTTVQNGVTTITLQIARPAIGKDQSKTIYLSYQTSDVVEYIGDTTTINIPRLAKANEAESYTRVVRISGIEGDPQFISPPANNISPSGDYMVYTFVGHQSDSLALLFGKSLTYKLSLTYELKNPEMSSGVSELALPMDTKYQHILLDSIDPAPSDIRLDENGNWLASYPLRPQEKLLVKAVVFATITPTPVLHDPSPVVFQKTHNSRYWDTTTQSITDLANRLKTPKNIYDYLVTNFTYNFSGVNSGTNRQGALSALSNSTSVLCTEFTDSFISLARSLGIPAREINGYGYTKSTTLEPSSSVSDVLHSWPEYYDDDQKSWIAVDPTWGNTTGGGDYFHKLDFGHIAFVRHGLEDSYPLPAGAYKSDATQKYVDVVVATTVPPEIKTYSTLGDAIYNTGNVAILHETAGYIPPYGSAKIANSQPLSFYDKIKLLCAKLLSKFSRRPPAST